MDSLFQDLRFGLRLLARNPGFTATIIAVLALAIGANITIFNVVHAVLMRPLPYSEPERLVQIWETQRSEGDLPSTISPLNFRDWELANESFEQMAVYAFSSLTLLGAEGPSRIVGVKVSGDFFSVLGVEPRLGRLLDERDDEPGSRVVVLSHGAWQRRFGADPGVVGKKLTLNGEPHLVIGVMPPDFQFPNPVTELWISPAFELKGLHRRSHFLFGVGRLRSGVTHSMAQSEAATLARRLAQEYPDTNEGSRILYVPLHEQVVGKVRSELLMLWGAVTLVLLIACANVANLLLARAIFRQREVSVRIALGAGRPRIIRQFLTESMLLVMAGGAAGLLLAFWCAGYLASGEIPGIPRASEIRVDGWVLGFAAALSLTTALVFGAAPAFHSVRSGLYALLNQSGWQMPRGGLGQRLPKLVIAFEVGIAVVLLISSGLLLKSLWRLHQVDIGFDPKGVLTMQVELPESAYPDPVKRTAIFQQVLDRIDAIPGTDTVGGTSDLPFSGSRTRDTFGIVGRQSHWRSEAQSADYRTVMGDYFSAMSIKLVKGRVFTTGDGRDGLQVAMINEALAERYFPDQDPLGKYLVVAGNTAEIVGIVANVKHDSLAGEVTPEIYVPYEQGKAPSWMYLTVRSQPGLELASTVRDAMREVLPEQPVYNIRTMGDRLALSIASKRFNTLIVSVFSALALVLAAIGIYGVMAYAARQRTREIALRMALGAHRNDVIRLMVMSGLIPAAFGIGIGLAGAFASARVLQMFLFGIAPTDPVIFLLVPVVLAVVAMLAGYLPAKRATAGDPLAALRSE